MNFEIRPFVEEDIPEITRLYTDTIQTIVAKDYTPEQIQAMIPVQEPFSRITVQEIWREHLSFGECFVANQGREIIGFGTAKQGYGDYYLEGLYVHRNRQREGIGSVILLSLENAAREHCAKKMILHATKGAVAFYLAQGYAPQGFEKMVLWSGQIPIEHCKMAKLLIAT
jgi:putative acetyltransferase